jgi:hypothetical protein
MRAAPGSAQALPPVCPCQLDSGVVPDSLGAVSASANSPNYSFPAMDPILLTTLLELDRRKTEMRRKCLKRNKRAIHAILEDMGATSLLQSCSFAHEDIRQMLDECIASQLSARSGRRDDDTYFCHIARTLSRAELEAIKKDICARLALVKEELDRDCAEAPRVKSETASWGARSFVESSRVHFLVNTVASVFVSLAFFATYYCTKEFSIFIRAGGLLY